MKKFLILLVIAGQFLTVHAQEFFDDYGSPTNDEIALKVCPFDKEADAAVLRREAFVLNGDDVQMITHNRVRLKILREKGIEEADIMIRFYSNNDNEKIDNIRAMVINYDEAGNKKVSYLDPKSIFTRKLDEYYSVISFAMPNVKVGSIIEYRYIRTCRYYRKVDYWYFQEELPVYISNFSFTILPNAEFAYRVLKNPEYPASVKQDQSQGKIMFGMTRLPGLRDEPFMNSREDYLQRVELQLTYHGTGLERDRFMNSWDDVATELLKDEDFGLQIGKNLPGTESFIKDIKAMPDDFEKMKRVHNYVRQNMGWDGYYGIYAFDGIKRAWDKKKGNTGKINLILINLLKSAGLDVYPLLVSERDNGKVNASYPFINQFNKVIAYVSMGGKSYFLDATDKNTPAGFIPFELLNTTAFVVHRKKGGLIEIKDLAKMDNTNIIIKAIISADGSMRGDALVINADYARIRTQAEVHADKNRFLNDRFIKPYNAMSIDSIKINNLDKDSLPLQSEVKFSYTLQNTGDYLFINLNLFGGLEKNPFVATDRFTDIDFGCRRAIYFDETISLPGGYDIDAVPKNINLIMQDTSIGFRREFFTDAEKKQLVARIKLEFNKPVFSAAEYRGVKEFYKKLFDLLNEPIVLKKKVIP